MLNEIEVPDEDLFDCEMQNEEFFDDRSLDNQENDHEILNEDFFDYEIPLFDDEMSNEEDSSDEIPDDKEPDKVVDEALGSEQMSSINGEFAPYFKNITEALMFCWIQKHNICKI
jgi:hypothetical protein